MSAKPALLPRWGEDTTGTIGPTELVPLSAKQDVGWANAEEPPAGYFNWLQRLTYKWLAYLKDAVFVADAGSVLPGVTATGDGASPGVKAIPGGGATPARGALNLPSQAAPTAPADGDLWTTAAGFFARIAGVTKTIIDQAYVDSGIAAIFSASHTWGGTQTFSNPVAGPSSTPVAPTLNANWTAGANGGTPAYWKDACGNVRIKGSVTAGAGASNPPFTLPAGFRPLASRGFSGVNANTQAPTAVFVNATGGVVGLTTTAGTETYLDAINFLAEA